MNKKAILIDCEGTLYTRDGVIEGTIQMIEKLRSLNYQIRFMTNTDSLSQESVYQHIKNLGYLVFKEEVYTPSRIVCQKLAEEMTSAYFLTSFDIQEEFKKNHIIQKKGIWFRRTFPCCYGRCERCISL